MADLPRGRISHRSAGRLRIRIPDRRRDKAFFGTVAGRLSGWASVDSVEVNPLTASVLVHFRDPDALFAEMDRRNDLFVLAPEQDGDSGRGHVALTDRASRIWRGADKTLRRWSGGTTDVRSIAFAMLMASAVYQLFRGRIFPPAGTLLWDAGDMLRLWQTALNDSDSGGNRKAAGGG